MGVVEGSHDTVHYKQIFLYWIRNEKKGHFVLKIIIYFNQRVTKLHQVNIFSNFTFVNSLRALNN